MKNKGLIIVIVMLLLVLIVGGIVVYANRDKNNGKDEQKPGERWKCDCERPGYYAFPNDDGVEHEQCREGRINYQMDC